MGISAQAAEGVVGNGGFETPAHESRWQVYTPGDAEMAPWTIGSGDVEQISDLYWVPAEGTMSLDLNGRGPASIYQDIDTVAGKTYTLTFSLSANPGDPQGLKTMDLYWGGQKASSFSFDSTGTDYQDMRWEQKSIRLTADTALTRLEFRSTTSSDSHGPALDDISLSGGAAVQPQGIGVSSFNPGLGSLIAIAFDHEVNNLFIYPEVNDQVFEYSTSGSQVGAGIPVPGARSNDFDMDFATESLSVGGDSVPANTLLAANNDAGNLVFAVDKDDGAIEAQQALPAGTAATGGAQHPARDSYFVVSWSEHLIKEVDPDDGALLNSFPVQPEGSPVFSTNYSDIDVDNETGNILVLSSNQNVIRLLSPAGEWLGDADVFNESDTEDPLRISAMSGVAIDDATKDVWITTTNGIVYKLTNLWENFSTAVPCESDPNALCGDDGDDEIQGTPEDDTIYAGEGDDTVNGGGGNDVIIGAAGNDTITGGDGNDVIVGDDAGKGTLPVLHSRALVAFLQEDTAGPPGNDILDGGGGNDQVKGGGGTDTVAGGAGKDRVTGQAGGDDLSGSAGPDFLNGGNGVDGMNGGGGKDTCVLDNKKERSRTASCEKKKLNFKLNFLPLRFLRSP